MRDVVLSISAMLKYTNIWFENNAVTFLDKISGKTNCAALGASEPTESAQTLQESLDALLVSDPVPNIRYVKEQCHQSTVSTRLSTLELPRY